MPAFRQVYLSYEKLSYVKIARVNGPANKFDKFHWIPDLQALAGLRFLRQSVFILMAGSKMLWSDAATSTLLETLQSCESLWNSKSVRTSNTAGQ